jgi:hypothetical protein
MTRQIRHAAVALLSCASLAGCGGGSGGGPGPAAIGPDVPQAALQSVQALVSWANDTVGRNTSSTSDSLAVSDVTLPTSDTSEPL